MKSLLAALGLLALPLGTFGQGLFFDRSSKDSVLEEGKGMLPGRRTAGNYQGRGALAPSGNVARAVPVQASEGLPEGMPEGWPWGEKPADDESKQAPPEEGGEETPPPQEEAP